MKVLVDLVARERTSGEVDPNIALTLLKPESPVDEGAAAQHPAFPAQIDGARSFLRECLDTITVICARSADAQEALEALGGPDGGGYAKLFASIFTSGPCLYPLTREAALFPLQLAALTPEPEHILLDPAVGRTILDTTAFSAFVETLPISLNAYDSLRRCVLLPSFCLMVYVY